ncbi:MAG: DUF2179 domain-containing protein [Candidatus Omnitrophota bacterium]
MGATTFFDSNLFTWGILPAVIFFARICDMSLDTMRIITIGQGRKGLAALLGFFEVTIWLFVARQVIVNLPNPLCFLAYAAGFATGNYVGMWIEEKFSSGAQIIRIIVDQNSKGILDALKREGFGFTLLSGQGSKGPVEMIFTIINSHRAKQVISLVEKLDPTAFYTIEDIRYVSEGVFPPVRRHLFGFLKDK